MKRIATLAVLGLFAGACESAPGVLAPVSPAGPVYSASTLTESLKIPFDLLVFVPCAAGGVGELVVLSGSLHVLFHITEDAAGGFHVKSHFQPQGISGFGLTTGAKYQATGVTQETFNATAGVTQTFVNNFRIIGQGRGNNFLVHDTFHVTINANGVVTAIVDNFTVECK